MTVTGGRFRNAAMDAETRGLIEQSIQQHPVVVFMKGSRRAPQCGFSARVVQILDSLVPEYETLDVLADQNLREGIKEFSSWPTIPQLYVRGEFIGGCDIVSELFETGQLQEKLGVKVEPLAPPQLSVSQRAQTALLDALESDSELVRLEVSPGFEHALSIGPSQKGDFVIEFGKLKLAVPRLSAARANGVSIDFVDTPEGPAFKIDNPNEPPKVQPLSVQALKQKLDAGEALTLVDVRTPREREIATIAGSKLLDDSTQAELEALDYSHPLVFFCHHGIRSRQAAEHFLRQGFRHVYNVNGGIEAWSQEIDPGVPRY